MEFRIANTFTASLTKLTGDEQKAVKTSAFDLQMNPASPGLRFHKLDRAKDPNFCSVSVNMDIRLIVHRTESSMLLCYVDHHDQAYRWAERRKLETHPKTGAAQLVEVRETVKEITIPSYVHGEAQLEEEPLLFRGVTDADFLAYGVPKDWIEDVRAADVDSLLTLADHLPGEAAEALLELATGGTPTLPQVLETGEDPFEHPDALRRFRLMTDIDELSRALEFPWDRWTIFLHPAQRNLVERRFNGPARVAGSAGTGKTVVALHRAVHLARLNPNARVLLTTFSDPLAKALEHKLRRLIGSEPKLAERIEVEAMNAVGLRLYRSKRAQPDLATDDDIGKALESALETSEGNRFSLRFMHGEWADIVDDWQLTNWEDYRDVRRLGRKTRLSAAQRTALWPLFEQVRASLKAAGKITIAEVFGVVAADITDRGLPPYDHVIVDEAQDLSVPQLKFLATLGANRPDGLFFSGDLGQRIFQAPFSWKALGVDIRGRSTVLRINYRTSHQIRTQSDRLLGPEVADVDGVVEDRRGTVSVFNGPSPGIQTLDSEEEECAAVSNWLKSVTGQGVPAHEIGVFVRSQAEIKRAKAAVAAAGLLDRIIDDGTDTVSNRVSVCTMHLAKGMEFRAVVVMACDEEIVPLQSRLESVADDSDLEDVYDTERHLLYVACTRARDHLLITSVEPASEFLDDLV